MELKKERILYIDNLRLLVIAFVVMQHLAVTYSGMGMWYYNEGVPLGIIPTISFGFYQSLTQGYFMGLLFLIAGYFVPRAFDSKGFGKFVKDRLIRLGIPALIYMLIINPLILYFQVGIGANVGFFNYYLSGYIGNLSFISGSGPLWFAIALLIFTVVYGLVRCMLPKKISTQKNTLQPTFKNVWILILLIAVSAFLIRIVQPIGTSVYLMQLCYFAQYIILFIVGIQAYRQNLFAKITYKFGKKWMIYGLIFGAVSWLVLMIAGGAMKSMDALNGGFTWQSAGYSLWESFIAVAIDIGLLAIFREKLNRQSRFVKALSDNSFAVYVFHPPIIIAAAILFRPVELPPAAKFGIMCVVCLPLCFLIAHFIVRKIPLLKKVM
jgi:glucans biosynthesis protein C